MSGQGRGKEEQKKENRRRVGTGYEKVAARALSQRGYRILTLNFRSRFGEIDIVGMDRGMLVFVEVKYRASGRAGLPWESVDLRKQYRICRTADFYRVRYRIGEQVPIRFDVVGILGEEITVFRNAFAYIPAG